MATDFTKKLMQLGASGTNPNNLDPQLGALAPYLNLMESAYPQQNLLSPEEQAFLFFTKMAEESSKPGATAIGAAGSAGQEFLKTRMAQKQIDATRNKDILTGAVSLSAALNKPKTLKNLDMGVATYMDEASALAQYPVAIHGQLYKQFIAPTGVEAGSPIIGSNGGQLGVKGIYEGNTLTSAFLYPMTTAMPTSTNSVGGMVNWVYGDTLDIARANAEKMLIEQGVDKTIPGFKYVVDKVATTDKNLDGAAFTVNDTYAQFNFGTTNGRRTSINFVPSKDASEPPIVGIRKNKMKFLTKASDAVNLKWMNVVPRVDGLLEALKSGAIETNRVKKMTQSLNEVLTTVFSMDTSEVIAGQSINSNSFALAPLMRPVGSGSTSDMEFNAYQKAVVELGNNSLTNYMSLYALKKLTQNSKTMMDKEIQMWSTGRMSPEKIDKEIGEIDQGIFYKFPGFSEEYLAMDKGDLKDAKGQAEIESFYSAIPDGGVINNPPTMNIDGVEFDMFGPRWKGQPYVVKGWQGKI
tara:strand:- start:189 stop:1757 length:1569 start_codon:yes stop_codon:yes gene_type:complete